MQAESKKYYFDSTRDKDIRDELKLASDLSVSKKVAIDCGCGSGSDIGFLLDEGFEVYAFDIEEYAIELCKRRYSRNSKVHLNIATFYDYAYPKTNLFVADSSLFFCHPNKFESVWQEICASLEPNGVFCGSFLGPKDSMIGSGGARTRYWDDLLVLSEERIIQLFENFSIKLFSEHLQEGINIEGAQHRWHIYSLVAKKIR
ncbi:class I SAM-dependent methyltransferase [Aliiglaciecola sp. M165]|uniref:class I SAM-dependent methyltransferase n=1 Tax=Aliiglaciecola sp. M165 TaxID=2593649 RepID=UPI0021B108D7|nr:class I SAM-dependent methyltransferase [Aliiglaciecola sp. M165]